MSRQHLLISLSTGALYLAGVAFGTVSALAGPTGTWTVVPDSGPVVINMSLTLMADGRVLMAGGGDTSDVTTTAQIFTPKTNAWTTVAPMLVPLDQDTATLLTDGKILVAGGTKNGINPDLQAQAEVYDPVANTWNFVGSLNTPRFDAMAIRLGNGKVLVCGGTQDVSNQLPSCELYNPSTGRFSLTGNMSIGRRYSSLVLLKSGDVMTDGDDYDAEIYSVSTGTWHTIAMPPYYNFGTTLSLLQNGNVMETPSDDAQGLKTEIYNPVTDTWSLTGGFTGVTYNTASTLKNGWIVSAGGCTRLCSIQNVTNAYLYRPATGLWSPLSPMNFGREDGSSVTLPDNRILVVGGGARPEILSR